MSPSSGSSSRRERPRSTRRAEAPAAPIDDEGRQDRRARRKAETQALVNRLDKAGYTAAARRLADDLDALVVHLHYPTRHRRRWRSTNLLERSLGEVKRRTKV
jgi:transposase-like protein